MAPKRATSAQKGRSRKKEAAAESVQRKQVGVENTMMAASSHDVDAVTPRKRRQLERVDSYAACVQLAEEKLGDKLGTDGVLGITNKKGQNIPTFMVPFWRDLKGDQKSFTTKQWHAVFDSFDLHSHLLKQTKIIGDDKC